MTQFRSGQRIRITADGPLNGRLATVVWVKTDGRAWVKVDGELPANHWNLADSSGHIKVDPSECEVIE